MANIDWMIRGPEMVTCNCAYGCPCQFNALPTHGDCRGVAAMRVDRGYHGTTDLDGLHFCLLLSWPGPVHEGRGEMLPIIDAGADAGQRRALLRIVLGEDSNGGMTHFAVFASTMDTVHPARFATIDFAADIDRRLGHLRIAGLVEASAEPIRNPVTGAEHRARMDLPGGFEFSRAECASGRARARTPIDLDWVGSHAHFAMIHLTQEGAVH